MPQLLHIRLASFGLFERIPAAVYLVKLMVLIQFERCQSHSGAVIILQPWANADINGFKLFVSPDVKTLHLRVVAQVKLSELVVKIIVVTMVDVVECVKVSQLFVIADIKLAERTLRADKMLKL